MIKFENVEVYNFDGALRNMRNSYESWERSDSEFYYDGSFDLGPADLKLAMKLSKAGSDHAKYLRQILVSVDITAGNEWWKEADTYKVGTVANSTSMMHKLGSRLLTPEDFSFDDASRPRVKALIDMLNGFIQDWWDSGKKQGSPEWRDMQKAMSMGFLYRRGFTCNYQVLKSMYHSRKNHRLSEWHDFAKWIETLPYSELITLREKEPNS